jgi:CelD/BcsL family acetyltransferase involved in cellulose biosynthesis
VPAGVVVMEWPFHRGDLGQDTMSDKEQTGGQTLARIVRTLEELDALKDSWKAFAASARYPTQEFAWVRACAATLAAPRDLHVVVVEDRSGPVAAAPLVRRRGGVRLELLGAEELREPSDLAWASEPALGALAEALVGRGLTLDLRRLPADSPTVAAIDRASRGRGAFVHRRANPYPRVHLNAGWAQPDQRLSSSKRSLLRRMRRRAEEMGTVTWEVLTPAPAAVAPLLEEAFRVEAASWKGHEGTALATDPLRGTFFRQYAVAAAEEGILRLGFLRIGGRAAAMQILVEYRRAYWIFKTGYDDEFKACSPGSLLIAELAGHAAGRGLEAYEFLGNVEEWTQMWTKDLVDCVSVRAYPLGFRGATALCTDALRVGAQRVGRLVRGREVAR